MAAIIGERKPEMESIIQAGRLSGAGAVITLPPNAKKRIPRRDQVQKSEMARKK